MLIIWDFDGVICDSDGLWADNWEKLLLREKNISITSEERRNLLIGISEKDKARRLEAYFQGLKINEEFIKKLNLLHDYGMKNLLKLTEGVEDIFKDKRFKQCIATGGNDYQNRTKNHAVGIDKYFTEQNCFTADMVKYGKPHPDIFLLAARKMKTPVRDCIVVEDSIDGIKAGKQAGMKVFAYIGALANHNEKYLKLCQSCGADKVFDNMKELYNAFMREFFIRQKQQNVSEY